MNLIRTNAPNETQTNSLLHLQEICRNHDNISLTFPMEEDCIYYLLCDEDVLLSALCAFFNENGDCECIAFTLPSKRNEGCFTRLLEELLKESGDCDLIFSAEETCQDTVRTLEALEASLWYREHLMELTTSDFPESPLAKGKTARAYGITMEITIAPSGSQGPVQYRFFKDNSPIGSCFLDVRKERAYLYGLEIREELRGNGLGSACLSVFLDTLFKQQEGERPEKLFLQVSGLNEPAMALYRKAGFHITESLSYYVY
ncbi:MAG: N-acetyltransferase [Lacrimispora sp.]